MHGWNCLGTVHLYVLNTDDACSTLQILCFERSSARWTEQASNERCCYVWSKVCLICCCCRKSWDVFYSEEQIRLFCYIFISGLLLCSHYFLLKLMVFDPENLQGSVPSVTHVSYQSYQAETAVMLQTLHIGTSDSSNMVVHNCCFWNIFIPFKTSLTNLACET